METIGDKLDRRALELDGESLKARLLALFGEEGTEHILARPFEMLNGKTPGEVAEAGSDEEKQVLERYLTFGETTPWYLTQNT